MKILVVFLAVLKRDELPTHPRQFLSGRTYIFMEKIKF